FYNTEKNRCHRGELTINKNGILDTSDDGIRIGLPWHLIEALIITDKVACFTSKTMTFFFVENTHVDEILQAVNTYQSELKVIDKRIHRTVKIDEEADNNAELINTESPIEENENNNEVKKDQEESVKEEKEPFAEIKEEIKKEEEKSDTEVEDKINELEGN
ncbi:MAG: hypothetical protein K2L98_02205, partial [Bacilli bacterium]|nr:hypothetical protein [Bacilli bacterium]